jgi:hypothetical protein
MIHQSGPANNSGTAFVLEPGVQVRAFVTPNVAVHGRVALAMTFGDNVAGYNDGHLNLGGELVSGFGFTYFFR